MENKNNYKQNNVIALVIRHFSTAMEDQRLMVTELIERLPVEIDGLKVGFRASSDPWAWVDRTHFNLRMHYAEQEDKVITKAVEEWQYTKIAKKPRQLDGEANEAFKEKYAAWVVDSSIDVLFIEPTANDKGVQDSWYVRNLRPTILDVPEGRKMEAGVEFEDKMMVRVTYEGEGFRGPRVDLCATQILKWFNLTPSDKDNVHDPRPVLAAEMQKVDVNTAMPNGLYFVGGSN